MINGPDEDEMNDLPEAQRVSSDQPTPSIVAIDDDPMVLLMISRTLAAAGMVCRTATSGAEHCRRRAAMASTQHTTQPT